MKDFHWKLILVGVVVLTTIICVLPTLRPGIWPYKKIALGLDLQGGMHVVLDVDTNKVIENILDQTSNEMRALLRKKQINTLHIDNMYKNKLRVLLKTNSDLKKFKDLINDDFPDLKLIDCNPDKNDSFEAILDFSTERKDQIRDFAVNQVLETIRNRIDQFGVTEPDIRLHGSKHILIQLPGIKETQRAKELIGRTAMLEFRIVDKNITPEQISKGLVPPGSVVMYQHITGKTGKIQTKIPISLNGHPVITGTHLSDAMVQIDSISHKPIVLLKLNKKGAKIFEKVTSENLNRRIAIVLDGVVHLAPVIEEVISEGVASIKGHLTMENAKDLAIVLRAGALPAPVKIIEERTVGPSLGRDSIRTGLISMCVGSLIVILFMAIYYKASGIIADFALILNVLIIAAGLAQFQATLTLPGIAGIILTIGMAVDANVLIFERIREEMRLGCSPKASVSAGYDRASLTILDSNITTLIAALVLFQFGTGPVKGFAVTLSLGIIASLFTSLILTRTIFDYLLSNRKIKSINI